MPLLPERLKDCQKWCVSKDKVPKDMHALARGLDWGVSTRRSHSCYVGFDEASSVSVRTGYPVTLWVDAAELGVYILDIEKTCPAEIRRQILLALHDAVLYLETSLSGKGFHLVVDIGERTALKTAKYRKWFEALSLHHCTFTMNEISFAEAFDMDVSENDPMPDGEKDSALWLGMQKPVGGLEFYDLVSDVRAPVAAGDTGGVSEYRAALNKFDGRHADLFNSLCDMVYAKTVDGDFHGDMSAYEFGYASKMHYLVQRLIVDMIDADGCHYEMALSREEAVMLVWMALKQVLPPRDKHREIRNGMPWLLYTSHQVYVKSFDR